MDKIGIITEQGDLGLGFDELNDKDQKAYQKYLKEEKQKENDKRKTSYDNSNRY